MKIHISSICFLIAVLFITAVGCDDMESTHEEYLTGEKIYAGKLDSLVTYSGYNRVKIVGQTRYLLNSNQCTVEWEDQSKQFTIDGDVGETFEMIIDSLEERSYEFTVHSTDAAGNNSVFQTCSGRSIGEQFRQGQLARRVTGYSATDEGTFVNWAPKEESEYVAFTEIRYDTNGETMATDTVYPDDSRTLLENYLSFGRLEIISAVVTGEDGFDTINLDTIVETLPAPPFLELDKGYFSLVWMPSDIRADAGAGWGYNPDEGLFNGDESYTGPKGYHSGGGGNFPQHLTIDLGVTAKVRKCRLGFRTDFGGNNPTHIELWGINDISGAQTPNGTTEEFEAAGWTKIYDGDIANAADILNTEFNIAPADSYRYIRYRVISAVNNDASELTEITFWGQDIMPVELDKSNFTLLWMPSDVNPDAGAGWGYNPDAALFNGDASYTAPFGYHSGGGNTPHHLTIDLGVKSILGMCRLDFRTPFRGNNPTEVEIWGINDVTNAQTASSDAAEFEAAGWTLLYRGSIDGANNDNATFNIDPADPYRYVRYRVVSAVNGDAGELTELTFWGYGPEPI